MTIHATLTMKNKLGEIYLIFSFMILLFSCSESECINTSQYDLAIKYYNTLKLTYEGEGVLVGENLLANFVLVNITGIESKASYGDITVYAQRSHFQHDLKRWKKWISNMSCKTDLRVMKEKETEILSTSDWIGN